VPMAAIALTGCNNKPDPIAVGAPTTNTEVIAAADDSAAIDNAIETAMTEKADKITKVETLIHTMPHDGMNDVRAIFPDLQLVKDVAKDANDNLSGGIGEESWEYSAQYDVTVVAYKKTNTPAHIFNGKTMSNEELAAAKAMMKETMEMNDEISDEPATAEPMTAVTTTDDTSAVATASYENYSVSKAAELIGKQRFAIFFYANQCSTCENWENSTTAALDTLPANTVILKADYDTETELKAKLGIKNQSTVTFFNADGTIAENAIDPSLDKVTEFFS